jgi:hypothetical protein
MGLFTDVIQAEANSLRPIAAFFFYFDTLPDPVAVWEGDGPLTREGVLWNGVGRRKDGSGNPLQSIEGLEEAMNGDAPELSMTLSGVDKSLMASARSDATDGNVEGRKLTVQVGFFSYVTGQPLGSLIPIGKWTLQRPSFAGQGVESRTIKITAENMFAARSRAPFALLTDHDQRRRFPDDQGLAFIPTMVNRTVRWPQF